MTAKGQMRFHPWRALRSVAKRLKLSSAAKRLNRDLGFGVLDWRARLKRPSLKHVTFIGVTGSCGKTTATVLIRDILAKTGTAQAYINEPAGMHPRNRVRRAILSVGQATRYYVYETATIGPGSIARQLEILKPQIGVVTTVGTDHRKLFRTLEATAKEKGTLVENLPPDGVAILNIDDPHVAAMAARTRARVITYGLSPQAEIRGSAVASRWPDRLALDVSHGGETAHIVTQLVGEHWATSVLAAIASGVACGLDLKHCGEAVAGLEPVYGRCSVHGREGGPAFVLDLKASSWTIPFALAFVAAASAPRKTFVFGTISDYAGDASGIYRRAARQTLAVADRVVFVGPHSGHVARLREREGGDRLFSFQTAHAASDFLAMEALPDELIYIKASHHADHLDRIMLAQLERVVCWREGCGKPWNCFDCKYYRRPSPPPFPTPVTETLPGVSSGDRMPRAGI